MFKNVPRQTWATEFLHQKKHCWCEAWFTPSRGRSSSCCAFVFIDFTLCMQINCRPHSQHSTRIRKMQDELISPYQRDEQCSSLYFSSVNFLSVQHEAHNLLLCLKPMNHREVLTNTLILPHIHHTSLHKLSPQTFANGFKAVNLKCLALETGLWFKSEVWYVQHWNASGHAERRQRSSVMFILTETCLKCAAFIFPPLRTWEFTSIVDSTWWCLTFHPWELEVFLSFTK